MILWMIVGLAVGFGLGFATAALMCAAGRRYPGEDR